MQIEKRKCRVCGIKPKIPFMPSRIKKRDWICCFCIKVQRKKWRENQKELWKKFQSKRPKKEVILNRIEILKDNIQVNRLRKKALCPYCYEKMIPTREPEDIGKVLKWDCQKCNFYIVNRKI